MNHREAINEHRHIVAGIVCSLRFLILVEDLNSVVVDILLVQQGDVLCRAVISCQIEDAILLYAPSLFFNAFVGVGEILGKKLLPFPVGEGIVVEKFQLAAEVGDEFRFGVDCHILIALRTELLNERLLQVGFALVEV